MKKVSFCLVLFLVILTGCHYNQKMSDLDPINLEAISLKEAKNWFNKLYGNLSTTRTGADKDYFKKAYWENAYEHSYQTAQGENKIVVVPFISQKAGISSGYKQLWIYKNRKGENTLRVVEYVYDHNDKTLFKSMKNFSGIMVFRDWDENFIGGFVVKNNKTTDIISDLQFGEYKDGFKNKKNGRSSGWSCGTVQYCVNSYTTVYGYGINQVYWHTDCVSDWSCFWTETTDLVPPSNTVILTPSSSPPSSTGDFSFRTELQTNKCQGFAKMLSVQANEGREVSGFLTTNDYVVIAPTNGNTIFTSSINSWYTDANGTTILGFYQENGKWYVEASPSFGNWKYEVKATLHTHPPGVDQNLPSDFDKQMASSYLSLQHYFLNWTNIVQFNSSGTVSSETNNCTIYSGN